MSTVPNTDIQLVEPTISQLFVRVKKSPIFGNASL